MREIREEKKNLFLKMWKKVKKKIYVDRRREREIKQEKEKKLSITG